MSKVVVEKCSDYNDDNVFDAISKAINHLGGIEKYVKPGMKIALKLNLVKKKRPEEAALETGASLNFDLSEVHVENPSGEYIKKVTIVKALADADLIINLPKLKTHGQMVYTGAVKNMFGAVPGELKAEYHLRMSEYNEFANALIDIYLSVKPSLNIMDAVIGMDGAGPTAGEPKHLDQLIVVKCFFEKS